MCTVQVCGVDIPMDVNVFIFQKNDRFVMKTTTKIEIETVVLKTIFFIKFVVSLMIVNDDPFVNDR